MYKKILIIVAAIALLGVIFLYLFYDLIYLNNVKIEETHSLYIETGTNFEEFTDQLKYEDIIKNWASFELLAKRMNLSNHIYGGHYQIEPGMSNLGLIRKLRGGEQDPIQVIFKKHRNIETLAATVSKQIEADSASIVGFVTDSLFLKNNKLNENTLMSIFLPNTYEFYWNADAQKFAQKMLQANNTFWNKARTAKAEKLGLSKIEVITLASIVQEESSKTDEMPNIAGVYLNRIKQGWRLQADPTVKFANNDFTLRRILNKHLEKDSPFNTYKHKGLPPGPICLPSTTTIDASLNAVDHPYMYFCAKEDFSGYHNFAETLKEHNANARKYHKALNKRKIY